MWLKIGCLRRPKHEISPNHLPWKLALAVSCARQWAFKWLLDSETCRMIYFWRSAKAAAGLRCKIRPQSAAYLPFRLDKLEWQFPNPLEMSFFPTPAYLYAMPFSRLDSMTRQTLSSIQSESIAIWSEISRPNGVKLYST